MTGAVKYDSGKPRMTLLCRAFIEGMARVLGFGAEKYSAHGFKAGLDLTRCLDAADRHLHAFIDGENLDPESGESHLYHCACSLMMADWMLKNRPELDDRYTMPEPSAAAQIYASLDEYLSKAAFLDPKKTILNHHAK